MIWQLMIAIDQLFNVLVWLPGDGFGRADETLSARSWRMRDRIGLWRLIDIIFLPFERNHCMRSYEAEMCRRHLPEEYRKGNSCCAW